MLWDTMHRQGAKTTIQITHADCLRGDQQVILLYKAKTNVYAVFTMHIDSFAKQR